MCSHGPIRSAQGIRRCMPTHTCCKLSGTERGTVCPRLRRCSASLSLDKSGSYGPYALAIASLGIPGQLANSISLRKNHIILQMTQYRLSSYYIV